MIGFYMDHVYISIYILYGHPPRTYLSPIYILYIYIYMDYIS